MIDREKMTDRELDALIAEYLFEYEVFSSRRDYFDKGKPYEPDFDPNVEYPAYYHDGYANIVLNYSNDPAACALVLDQIEHRLKLCWEWSYNDQKEKGSSFVIFRYSGDFKINDNVLPRVVEYGRASVDNRYRAVCLAVLNALDKSSSNTE